MHLVAKPLALALFLGSTFTILIRAGNEGEVGLTPVLKQIRMSTHLETHKLVLPVYGKGKKSSKLTSYFLVLNGRDSCQQDVED